MNQNLIIFLLILLTAIAYGVWDNQRRVKRRKSLRTERQSDGGIVYIWIDFDGTTKSDKTHPDEPRGAWSSSGDGFGDGGGDGGGGGGD